MRFEIFQDARNEWRWRLRAANLVDIIADSGEGYVNKSACERGVELVQSTTTETVIIYLA